MKVLLVHPGASWSTADVEAGLRYGLEQHGVQVIQYRLDGRLAVTRRVLMSAWRDAKRATPTLTKPTTPQIFYVAAEGAICKALHHEVDIVLIISGMYLHPNVPVLMRRAGLRVVCLFTESPYEIEHEVEFAKHLDGCWTNERTSVPDFLAVNSRSGYLPHAWHPLNHQPHTTAGDASVDSHDVVFVGSAFEERIELLSAIDWSGIDLGLYGNWQALPSRHHLRRFIRAGTIQNATAAALYRRAKIGLNLYRTSKAGGRNSPRIVHEADSINPRGYELAACGAFHLSTYRAEVAEIFGSLVPTFQTAAEASALIRRWLADPDGRARISAQLPACVAHSSWVARAAQVIGDIQSLLQQRAA